MDIFDQTQDRMEAEEALRRMQAELRGPYQEVERKGKCNNCLEPVEKHMPFCDTFCRDDYQRRVK